MIGEKGYEMNTMDFIDREQNHLRRLQLRHKEFPLERKSLLQIRNTTQILSDSGEQETAGTGKRT